MPPAELPAPGTMESQLDNLCARLSHNLKWSCCSVVFLVVMSIFILSLCLAKSPDNVRCHVTEASLVTDSNLTIRITIRNPNGFYHVHHDHINFTAYYQNQTSGSLLNNASFSQGRKNETHLTPSFNGMQILRGGNDSDSRENYYDILVKFNMQDEYKRQLVPRTRHHRHLEYSCELKVPASSASSFNTTLCRYHNLDP
ncbi:hypothetical protein ACLB2K_076754 [Fragaria x ananassa]